MVEVLILIAGAFLAAAISGAAGFGGALILLPLLTRVVGVTAAVPLLTLAQLVGNVSRAGFGWRRIHWRPVGLFLATALPCAALGAMSFVSLPKSLAVRIVGAAILAFLALRLLGVLKVRPSRTLLLLGGAAVGGLSGLVGSAGPLGAAVFLSLNLPPVAYVASEAVTAVGIHAVKLSVYGLELRLPGRLWLLAAALGLAMIFGTWVSRRLVERIPAAWFQRLVAVLLAFVALQMLVAG